MSNPSLQPNSDRISQEALGVSKELLEMCKKLVEENKVLHEMVKTNETLRVLERKQIILSLVGGISLN